MDVFCFRGVPGSRTVEVARTLLYRPFDHVIDLSSFYETSQGNLFMTEELPIEAKNEVEKLLRAEEISRLAICGMMDKGWVEQIISEIGVENVDVYWLVVEGAEKPTGASDRFYDRLERNFEIDLTK